MLDAWRYLIPDIPDAFDPVVWILIGLATGYGLYRWWKSREEKASEPDALVRKLTLGLGRKAPTVCLIYYRGGGFTETWASEHAKTLSWALPAYLDVMRRAYLEAGRPVHIMTDPVIHHVEVSQAGPGPAENGAIRLFPDGAVIHLRAFHNHHDSGAWGWELRNYVRHYEAGIETGGEREFIPVLHGDVEAQLHESAYRHRP